MARRKAEGEGSGLAPEDLALWSHVNRQTRPLAPQSKPAPAPAKPPLARPSPAPAAPLAVIPPAPPRLPPLSQDAAPGLDARTAERLRRGALAIEARLDLHGLTQAEAHRALLAFIDRAWRLRLRALLVITGKGRGSEGVLRQAVPRWLNEGPLRARLLAFAAAQPKDGGGGALYLLLRRQREGAP